MGAIVTYTCDWCKKAVEIIAKSTGPYAENMFFDPPVPSWDKVTWKNGNCEIFCSSKCKTSRHDAIYPPEKQELIKTIAKLQKELEKFSAEL